MYVCTIYYLEAFEICVDWELVFFEKVFCVVYLLVGGATAVGIIKPKSLPLPLPVLSISML